MPKKGHTEEQIVAVLRRVEADERVGGHLPQGLDQPGDLLSVEEAGSLSHQLAACGEAMIACAKDGAGQIHELLLLY